MTGICVVLFTCSREFGPDYNDSIEFYSREIPVNNLFHIDCANWSTRINHLVYMQGEKPSLTNHRGMYFSKHEILQLNAVVKYLPKYCEFVYKITGKYQILHLWSTIKLINHNFTNLVIQGSRRHSFWGWSCELFGCNRNLLKAMLMDMIHVKNTERFLLKLKKVVSAIDASTIRFLPKMFLRVRTQRTSDGIYLKSL